MVYSILNVSRVERDAHAALSQLPRSRHTIGERARPMQAPRSYRRYYMYSI